MSAEQQKNEDLLNKISDGLKLAIRKLYDEMAAKNEMAVIGDGANGVKWVSAREVVEARKQEERRLKK